VRAWICAGSVGECGGGKAFGVLAIQPQPAPERNDRGVSGAFREAIDRIIAWCSERGSREKVAGRYPLSGLSEKQLERVLRELHN
jgi:hypothetical protein